MNLFNFAVPFFIPMWRRYLLVILALGWGGFEFATNQPFWGMIFLAVGIAAVWQFMRADWDAIAATENDKS
jgi:hypothetical protein